ncbi:MAG: hypothetical protein FJ096_09175 [Deltaproteobacteria bacterium]|nr:hypothetical protein [Deltaproteobacteria bacterium]
MAPFARTLVASGACVLVFTLASSARADGAYGRLDGDLAVALDAGLSAGGQGAGFAARARASYLSMAGIYLGFEEGLGLPEQSLERRMAGGVEVRPLFVARFLSDLERGPALLDLWLDSTGLDVGAHVTWLSPAVCAAGCRSDGLELAAHTALPLVARASSPFVGLRVGVRLALDSSAPVVENATQGFVALSLGYQHVLRTGLVGLAP